MDLLTKLVRLAGIDQVDGAAAEPASRHAGSITTGEAGGDFDQRIQLTAAGLEVIAEAAVCFGHQCAEGREVGAFERGRGKFHSFVLSDDVTAAAKNVLRHR